MAFIAVKIHEIWMNHDYHRHKSYWHKYNNQLNISQLCSWALFYVYVCSKCVLRCRRCCWSRADVFSQSRATQRHLPNGFLMVSACDRKAISKAIWWRKMLSILVDGEHHIVRMLDVRDPIANALRERIPCGLMTIYFFSRSLCSFPTIFICVACITARLLHMPMCQSATSWLSAIIFIIIIISREMRTQHDCDLFDCM